MPKALYVVKSSLNTNTPTRTAVRGSNAPNKEVNVGPANFTAFTNVILEIAVAGSASPPIYISRKTKCSAFTKHFVPKSHLLTQFKM